MDVTLTFTKNELQELRNSVVIAQSHFYDYDTDENNTHKVLLLRKIEDALKEIELREGEK